MEALRKVMLYLGVDVEQAKLDRAQAGVSKLQSSSGSAAAGFGRLGGALRGIVGLVAGGAMFDALVGGTARAGDEAAKTSQRVGITVEQYQRLHWAAKLSGAGVETLNVGLITLSRNAVAGSKAGSVQALAFDRLGVSARNADGSLKQSDALLLELADGFAALPAGVDKTVLATQLFGEAGTKLMPLLNAGSAGIRAMGDDAEQLGIVMSASQAAGTEQYNDSMDRLKAVVQGLRNTLALALMPTLTAAADRFAQWWRSGDNARRFAERFAKTAKLLAGVLAAKAAVKGASLLAGGIKAIGSAGALATAKLALITGSIALLALLLEDLYTFMKGGDSLIGSLLGKGDAETLRAAIGGIGEAFGKIFQAIKPKLIETLRAALQWVADHAEDIAKVVAGVVVAIIEVAKFIKSAFEVVGEALGNAAGWLVIAWGDAVDWLAGAIGVVADAIGSAVDWAVEKLTSLWDWVSKAFGGVVDFFSGIADAIGGTFSAAIEALLDTLREVILAMPGELVPDTLLKWAHGGASTSAALDPAAQRAESDERLAQYAAAGSAAGLDSSSPRAIAARNERLARRGLAVDTASSAAGAQLSATGSAARQPQLSVGSVGVTVNGSADMTSPAMQAAVKKGVEQALGDLVASTYSDLEAAT